MPTGPASVIVDVPVVRAPVEEVVKPTLYVAAALAVAGVGLGPLTPATPLPIT